MTVEPSYSYILYIYIKTTGTREREAGRDMRADLREVWGEIGMESGG
jgi:hypothetical protein